MTNHKSRGMAWFVMLSMYITNHANYLINRVSELLRYLTVDDDGIENCLEQILVILNQVDSSHRKFTVTALNRPLLFLTAYISKTKWDKKKYEEMNAFLNCDLPIFRNYLPNVAIRNSMQTDEIFGSFLISWFLCTGYLKNCLS